ncbi:MAG TPA: serine hydrolase domain-containing protein [Candidatus Elarobacter sp.]|nr:serine hydrolase domain-containing protein [Candidatus Elarobacter sp.]
MSLRIVACTVLALLVPVSAQAPSIAADSRPALTATQLAAIDAFVTAEMKRERVPGVAVGIYSRGKILLTKGYGESNVELSVPVKPETIFQSGSVGKQFVSAAVMMLVEDGKVSLDDSITKYFPDAPTAWKPILVKNLLSHTSGLSEYETPERTAPDGPFDMRKDYTEADFVKKIEALPIENPPGDKWNYRNTNYLLLGILIHHVTGTFYADFLAQRIFKPLGMTSTRLISEADIIPNRAAGYELHGTELKNQEWVSPTFNTTADGTLYFNVLDLARWDEALYTTRLLKQSSLDRIWTVFPLNDGKPNADNYGFAWIIDKQNGHGRIEHGGAWQGFTCNISRYPDDALTVVVLANLDAARPFYFSHVIAGLADAPLLPPKLTAIDDTQPAIAASLRTLLDRIAAGQDISDKVTPEFARVITPERTKTVQKRVSPLWPGGTLTLVRRLPAPNDPTRTFSNFRLTKGDQAMLVNYVLTADGKVSGLQFLPDREYQL